MLKLKIKSILMAYNRGSDIIDQAEVNLKSSFSMDGQLFKRDEYEQRNAVRYDWYNFQVSRKIQKVHG